MNKKLIGILVCMLLIAGPVLSVAGTIDNSETKKSVFSTNNSLIQHNGFEINIMSNWVEVEKLHASDGTGGDFFGMSVSIKDDYALVGAYGDGAGSAYVFKREGADWIQQDKLIASDGEDGDFFGYSVSIDDDYALIGAYYDENSKGSAYVFKRDGTNWIEEAKLTASDGLTMAFFGHCVLIIGDFALIGAGDGAGSAYVFKRDGTNWIEEAKLTASDGETQDGFGISISFNGDYAIIGASRDDDYTGSAYVFKRDGTNWIEEAKLTASDGSPGDWFGRSISINGEYAFIGAPEDNSYEGSVYIFKRNGTNWIEEAKLTALDGGEGDRFGVSISTSGNYAIIGADWDDNDRGSVYDFKRNGISWDEKSKLTASDGENGDQFGKSVSMSGNYIIIGARADDDNGEQSGSAYVFRKNHPPSAPSIDGRTSGDAGTSYEYGFISTDPDSNDIAEYIIDWGDDTGEEIITGPFASGERADGSHTWTTGGDFTITAKAKDTNGLVGPEGTLDVTMPRNRLLTNTLFLRFLQQFPLLRLLLQRLGLQ